MNRIAFAALMLGLSLAPVLCWAEEPQTRASNNDAAQLKAAEDERIEVLTRLVEVLTSRYAAGTADFPEVFSAESQLWNAQLDSTDEPQKRLALLAKQFDRASEILKLAQARFAAGTVTETNVLRAKSLCLDVKIKLLREPAGIARELVPTSALSSVVRRGPFTGLPRRRRYRPGVHAGFTWGVIAGPAFRPCQARSRASFTGA